MYIERTEIGWYRGRIKGDLSCVLAPTRMGVIKTLLLKIQWMRK